MFATAATTLLSFAIVGVLATDEGLMSGQNNVPIPFTTSCVLKVVSSGSSSSGESYNGDVSFFAGPKELLLVGLHPEYQKGVLGIKNDVFKRGTRKWNYQWLSAEFPNPDENMQREYTFDFQDTELILSSQGKLIIAIPYNELTNDQDRFLSDINNVKFGIPNIDLKYATICAESSKSKAILFLYDNANQQGTGFSIHGPTPNFNDINFNDRTDSVWAVIGNWELYTDYDYKGERFLVTEYQKINAKTNNQYSSARPANCRYVSDPTTAKIRISTTSHFQGGMQEFLTPQKDLGEWKNKITSVIADKGDWELYKGGSFSGDRLLVREKEQIEDLRYHGFDNAIVSLRPVCETYKGKEKCTLNRVEIVDKDGDLEPKYTGTEVIGSQSSGSCYGPATHEIGITQVNGVEESFSLEVSREDEVNWSATASVEVEASAKILGTGASVSVGASVGAGGAVILGSTKTTESVTTNEKEHGQVTQFQVPGAGIVFGIVDRYEIDQSAVPVKMHMTCSDGQNKTVDSTMALKQLSFGAAHFWSLTGQFNKQACRANRELPDCVSNVRKNFFNFVGQKSAIEDAFEKCFADGKGDF